MDSDRWGLALSTAGLIAAFASQIPESDGLLFIAYAVTGSGAWLLVRERTPAWTRLAGSALMAGLALLVLVRQELVIGFRGETLAHLGLVLEAPLWDAVLVLPPFVVVASALVSRTRGWGRHAAGLGLALAGVTVLLATQLVPIVTVGSNVVGGALVFVLGALLVALARFGMNLRSHRAQPPGPPAG